jgi:hypothetical protein
MARDPLSLTLEVHYTQLHAYEIRKINRRIKAIEVHDDTVQRQ